MAIGYMQLRNVVLVLVLAITAGFIVACGADDTPTPPPTPTTAAATPTPVLVPAIASIQDPAVRAKVQQLYEAAQTEGTLLVTGMGEGEFEQQIPAFLEKYPGVKFERDAVTGFQAAAKIATEVAAGASTADVHIFSLQTTLILQRNDLIDKTTDWDSYGLLPGRFIEESGTVNYTHFPCCQFQYNTDFLTADDMPKTFSDLLDPAQQSKWRDKIVSTPFLYGSIWGWYSLGFPPDQAEAATLEAADRVTEELNILLTDNPQPLFLSGERPIFWNSSARVVRDLREGLPADWIHLPEFRGVIAWNAAIIKDTPRINAARLFLLHLASAEGQAAVGRSSAFAYMGPGWDPDEPVVKLYIERDMEMEGLGAFMEGPHNEEQRSDIATKARDLLTR